MKYFIGACLCIALFSECSSSGTPAKKEEDSTAVAGDILVVPQTTPVRGVFKGDFDGSPIYISINFFSGKHVAGYNIHKGLRRNLSGSIQPSGDGWELLLNEPGDHPFDGKFKLEFDEKLTTAKAVWTPLDATTLKEKQFTLTKVKTDADEERNYEMQEFSANNIYSADHADITFENDGSCLFNYYEKITDSTFVEQMTTVRGTWEKKDSSLLISWQKNDQWDKANSTFNIHYQTDEDGKRYMTNITGAGFVFGFVF